MIIIRPQLLINDLQWLSDKHGVDMAELAENFADICDYVIECNQRGITVDQHLNQIKGEYIERRTATDSK